MSRNLFTLKQCVLQVSTPINISMELKYHSGQLIPTNTTHQILNMWLLHQLPTKDRLYASIDTITDPTQVMTYITEFLNSQQPSGMPLHKHCLRLGSLIIIMTNLKPTRLCNGAILVVTQLLDYITEAKILTEQGAGDIVFISWIPLNLTSYSKWKDYS